MSPKRPFNIMLEPEQIDALRKIEERTGATPSEQIRRAINRWLEEQGAVATSAPQRRRRTKK